MDNEPDGIELRTIANNPLTQKLNREFAECLERQDANPPIIAERVGTTDVNLMLTMIGGWHVSCPADLEAKDAVDYAMRRGWVRTRVHFAPAIPDGSLAYELTDAGLDHLAVTRGERARLIAERVRAWYRANLKKHLEAIRVQAAESAGRPTPGIPGGEVRQGQAGQGAEG